MGKIIFDLILILLNGLVVFDEDNPKILKRLGLLAIIMLVISVTIQILRMVGIL